MDSAWKNHISEVRAKIMRSWPDTVRGLPDSWRQRCKEPKGNRSTQVPQPRESYPNLAWPWQAPAVVRRGPEEEGCNGGESLDTRHPSRGRKLDSKQTASQLSRALHLAGKLAA